MLPILHRSTNHIRDSSPNEAEPLLRVLGAASQIRNDESQATFERTIANIRDEAGEDNRKRARKAKMSDAALAGETIECIMVSGELWQSTKMLFGCRGSPLWVRADADTLAFIQMAMHKNFASNEERPERKRRNIQPKKKATTPTTDSQHAADDAITPSETSAGSGRNRSAGSAGAAHDGEERDDIN